MKPPPRVTLPIFGLGVLCGVAVSAISLLPFSIESNPLPGVQMSYADLAAVMLAAVSVIVTVLGVVIAILALWGFRHFREVAEQTANTHVKDKLESITEKVETAVMDHVIREMEAGRIKDILEARADYFLKYGPQVRAAAGEWEGNEEKEYGE